MKQIILFGLVILLMISSCKKNENPTPSTLPSGIYEKTIYNKSDVKVTELAYTTRNNFQNLQYSSERTKSVEINQPTVTSKMDIYLPPNASATAKQPLLVLIHGGGYTAGDKGDWQSDAYNYAQAGYICASLNYRLTQNGGNQTPQLRLFAVQSALEDIQNAIRFLKKNATTYFIDVTRIAVIGGSAGGGLSLSNAIEFDANIGTNDHPGFSSKTNGSVSTGATLVNNDPATQLSTITYNSFDSPVLLFHAKETDFNTGATWTSNVLPTQNAIINSGNSCTVVPQPNMTHTVNLSIGSDYWQYVKPFLWSNLKISELVK